MTRKLEELFDLQPNVTDDPVTTTDIFDEQQPLTLPETLDALDKIEAALPAVKGLEASDQEMDELATKATESFDSLMDLGMNVDSRYASEIFSVAGQMLGHAITAKTAKMNKKLRMIDLQLKKVKLDQTGVDSDKVPSAEGRIIDRNELLRQVVSMHQAAEKPINGK
jgi:hypothetical protein